MCHRNIHRCLLGTALAGGLSIFGALAANAAGSIAATAPMSAGYSSAPSALANTGVNTGLLIAGLLFLAFGGLLALILGRKRR